ncbi:uncharacterized protein [Spinacia oleracea]|uniref:CASP-like protein n=1 Tax=Spinacia oleracea TaxID=3562 RepID=A0A9R0IKX4_SPIOL|nr:uncharacterized protein LOC110789634 [Spinacia oleracea]
MREPKTVEYLVVIFLGMAAAGLAFGAEATRIKASDVSIPAFGKCEYPRSPAIILGSVAASLALINQIIISVVVRYAYRGTIHNSKTICGAMFCFILSWVMCCTGIGLLVAGVYFSSRQEFLASIGRCYTLNRKLLGTGGWMVLFASSDGLCAFYYFSVDCCSADRRSAPEAVP